jgi:uncharacterized protein
MYEVEPLKKINFGATGVEEVLQNVAFIMSTTLMSCPLDRAFGIDQSIIDSPIHIAQTRYTASLVEAITKFEPRAVVIDVTYTGEPLKGKLTPKVKVSINDEI